MSAYEDWKEARRQALIERAEAALAQGLDYVPWWDDITAGREEASEEGSAEGEREEKDDATLRRLANQAEIGPRTPEYHQQLMLLAAAEARKWSGGPQADGFTQQGGDAAGVSPSQQGTRPWINLGPGSARSSYNGTYYKAIDSGRATQIRVHPTNPKTVYLATAGGGVWRTTDFGQFPTWTPLTDGMGSLAIGAMELDPANPDILWLGLGDAFDQQGGGVVKSTDAGATWSMPQALSAVHPVDGKPTLANNVRELRIDPLDSNHLLVAADDGLYRSTDGGASFAFLDLPNTAATGPVRESTWSIVFLGSSGGQSQWLVSGMYACPGSTQTPNPASGTQSRVYGAAVCAGTSVGNYGDIWKSTDSGNTWVSARASGLLPGSVTGAPATDIGRIQLATGGTADPAATVVYALAGSLSETPSAATNAVLKSTDGGATWMVKGTKTTPVTNPTGGNNCTNLDVGHLQSWYNLAIAVDPGDANRVIIGGDLCGVRTIDGGTTWQNVAHWLPQGGGGLTADGFLPYVHADWHTATIVRVGSTTMTLAGTDGGIYVSYDVFDRATGATVTWHFPDVGLVTHLPYSVGSGDPIYGRGGVVFAGLQDNGTRFRLLEDEAYIFEYTEQNWDQVRGGDGIGTAVVNDPTGQNPVYWISVQNQHLYCLPRLRDCSRATRIEGGIEIANYTRSQLSTLTTGDSYPFFIRYSPINDAASSVLTTTTNNVYRVRVDPSGSGSTWTRLTPSGLVAAGATRSTRGLGAYASPHTYTVDGVPARVYGVALSGGTSAVIVDKGSSFNVMGSATVLQVPNGSGGFDQLGFIQSVAIPRDPANLGGTDVKQTWVVASAAAATLAGGPISDEVGHLFKTTDGGATWVPFHGNGTGADLPNVPVWVVRFDPSDPTDSTVYAGTELGMYRSTDGGNTWARYGVGLPLVRVYDLTLSNNGSLLRIATYGRGVWEIHPHSEAAPAPANGDWDGNGVIDYFDMAPMAGRLGSTPATSSNLRYDSTLDLTGDSTTIEEADLSSLVGKFGSTP
jgi:hypothetical protein